MAKFSHFFKLQWLNLRQSFIKLQKHLYDREVTGLEVIDSEH